MLAWELARLCLPESRPSFAPLTAIIALGATVGARGTRALQVAAGVAVGLGVANIAVRVLGAGAWQLGLVTSLALLAAVMVSADATLVVQAGVSGALVVALGNSDAVFPYRFLEALVGAGVALVFSQLLFPSNAVASVRGTARDILELVADGLDRGGRALRADDGEELSSAHHHLRDAASHLADLDDALADARRAQRVTRPSRDRRGRLAHYLEVPAHLESVVSDSSALLRAANRAVTSGSDRDRTTEPIDTVGTIAGRIAKALDCPDPAGSVVEFIAPARNLPDDLGGEGAPAEQAVVDLSSSARRRLRRLAEEIAGAPEGS